MAASKKSPVNPKIVIVVVVVLLLVGAGAFLMSGKKSTQNSSTTQDTNAFTSIKDAFSKSLSLECEFTDESGTKSKVFIKNGAMRGDFTGTTEEQSGSMIFKDKKMYFWKGQEGSVMTVPDETAEDSAEGNEDNSQGQNFLKEVEQYKDSCKPAVVSDNLFTPPADVVFTDLSKMMENLPKGNSQIPAESGVSEEDLKKMMQQYSDQ